VNSLCRAVIEAYGYVFHVIKYVAEQNPKAAAVKVNDLIDTSWLKKLDGEGFFEKVYGGSSRVDSRILTTKDVNNTKSCIRR
jgi:hypothetical protein